MYLKYQWLATATEANIRADIAAILCGTAIAGLSAGCDKVNSASLASTVAPGWELWDAAASVTSIVVRALNADGISYKYLQIAFTAGNVYFTGWELWSVGSHTGTNQTFAYGVACNPSLALNNTVANAIYISATARRVSLFQGPLWGSQISLHLFEFSRDTNSLNASYPCHGIAHLNNANISFLDVVASGIPSVANGGLGLSRVKNPSIVSGDYVGAALTGGAYQMVRSAPSTTAPGMPTALNPTYGADGVAYLQTYPITLCYYSATNNVQVLGKLLGDTVYLAPALPAFTALDEVNIGGAAYILHRAGNFGGAIAFKKE